MRRGWMDWVPQEVPEELLRARLAQVAAACRVAGADALLLYASFTRPAYVSALTHFVPFWSQAMLAVAADGRTLLTMATTGRTVQWIRSTACVDEVVVGPEIGATVSEWLAGRDARVLAVAGLPDVPQAALDGLRRKLPNAQLREAQDWYAPLEVGFGPAPAVAQRTLQIARDGLALVGAQACTDAHAVVAMIDGHCRAAGAEEVAVWLAPDLAHGALLRRLEGQAPLGKRFAVQVSLAYKGCWMRLGGSYVRNGATATELPASVSARAQLQQIAAGVASADLAADAARAAGAPLQDWSLEARRGGLPLATVAAADYAGEELVPAASTFSLRLGTGADCIVLAEPVAFS